MELLQLKYFISAAEQESFTKTALKFGVPPSDISQSIKRLERELGHKLFDRTPNRVSLSERGKLFLKGASQAMIEIEKAVASLNDDPEVGSVKILAASTRRLVMQTVEKFKRLYPSVEVSVSCDESADPDEFDIAISDSDFDRFGDGELLLSEEMILAINKSNPLSSKHKISADDLKNEPFISMNRETSLARTSERILRGAGIDPTFSIRSEDPFYVRKCVELGLGISIFPSVSWSGMFSDGVVLRPFTGEKRKTYLYINSKKYKKKCTDVFCAMLREEYQNA